MSLFRAREGWHSASSVELSDETATGVGLATLRLAGGERHQDTDPLRERAWVLVRGSVSIRFADGSQHQFARKSLFDDAPSGVHVGAGSAIEMTAGAEGCEWLCARATQAAPQSPHIWQPGDIQPEYRGAGLMQEASVRNVRLIFDARARPASALVVGEVVNFPGRWSSYPPHHHAQREVYHYRFTEPQGYGHAELGEDVFKIRSGDTLAIPGGKTHAQVSAPGYGMYYLWVVRHDAHARYTGFEFVPEHRWMLDPAKQGWVPHLPPEAR